MMSMINKTYKNATSVLNRYVVGLLLTEGKKSCSGMGSCLALSHDKLYSSLTFISGNFELIQNFALRIIKKYSVADKGWLIVDDTAVTKVYSKVIQGVVWMYNVLARREQKQLNILVLAWTNDVITIPLDFELWYPKNACDTYQTKSEVVINLLNKWWYKLPSRGIIGDGHFSTLELLQFCIRKKIPLVAKFASNRKVSTSDGISEQIKNHVALKLRRNQRSKTVKIIWHGMILFCTVHKRKNKKNEYNFIYYISTVRKTAKEYVKIYELRWNIEKIFRTMKQSLGLTDCSARKGTMQKGHIFGIFHAYTIAQIIKTEKNLPNVEGVIKALRKPKSTPIDIPIDMLDHNFGAIA